VADITGLPQHLIRYHVERGHIPIRRQSHKVHYYSDVEVLAFSAVQAGVDAVFRLTRRRCRGRKWPAGTGTKRLQ
jgi:hypothetical protein